MPSENVCAASNYEYPAAELQVAEADRSEIHTGQTSHFETSLGSRTRVVHAVLLLSTAATRSVDTGEITPFSVMIA